MRNEATKVVEQLIEHDKNVLALTADNRNEIYERIMYNYPEQYIEYGIAEENMVASAAGLASCGKIPFLYTITNFMSMHAYEFIRNDVCIPNRNVKFLGRSSGLVSSSMGPTHQGTEELGLLIPLPNLITITPSTPIMAREATLYAYAHRGPVYIRLEGFNEPEYYSEDFQFDVGKGYVVKDGNDVVIYSMGSIVSEVLEAADILEKKHNIKVAVIDMPTIKPIDRDIIINYGKKSRCALTVEEHSVYYGLGSAVADVIAEEGLGIPFRKIGLGSCVEICANRKGLRSYYNIDAQSIVDVVCQLQD